MPPSFQTKRLPFVCQQESGSDSLGGAIPVAHNIVMEPTGAVRRRPGITTYAEAPATSLDAGGIIGLYAVESGMLFAAGATGSGARNARPVYAISGGSSSEVGRLAGTERAMFASTEMLLVAAGGAEILKVELVGFASGDLSPDAPLSSHVIANGQRLVANDTVIDRTKIRYSGQAQGTTTYAGHEAWAVGDGTAGFFTAEARPDSVLALHENTNEVFVFGTETTEIYGADPVLVYAVSAAREVGCAAAYSVVKSDSSFFWLDHLRRFVMSDGRSMEVISDPIQRTLDELGTVSDCFGFRVKRGPIDCVVWLFPTDGRGFCFQKGAGWSQWSGYDVGTGNWERFVVNAHHLQAQSGVNIVGTTDGRIGQLSFDATTDLGTPVRAYIETGFESHGTDVRKNCLGVRLTLRRGETASATGPVALLRWRDEPGDWAGVVEVDLGASGDRYPVVPLRTLGVYRRRQWCFEFQGTEELVLLSAEEDFEILD